MKQRAFLLVFLGLVLAGCGGSGTLTKAQYDTKVGHLCLVAADGIRELHMDNSLGAWQHSGDAVVRIAKQFDDRLAALKAPSAIASGAADFLKANQKLAADYEDAVKAAKAGDSAMLQKIAVRANTDGTATFAPAKAIGATGCYIG